MIDQGRLVEWIRCFEAMCAHKRARRNRRYVEGSELPGRLPCNSKIDFRAPRPLGAWGKKRVIGVAVAACRSRLKKLLQPQDLSADPRGVRVDGIPWTLAAMVSEVALQLWESGEMFTYARVVWTAIALYGRDVRGARINMNAVLDCLIDYDVRGDPVSLSEVLTPELSRRGIGVVQWAELCTELHERVNSPWAELEGSPWTQGWVESMSDPSFNQPVGAGARMESWMAGEGAYRLLTGDTLERLLAARRAAALRAQQNAAPQNAAPQRVVQIG